MTFEVLKVATLVGLLAPAALAVPNHCLVKVDSGPCRAAFPRWAYNETTKACEQFTFGGCRPNGNNFGSKVLCEKSCVIAPRAGNGAEDSQNVCELEPKERGPCKAVMKRWSYDSDAKKCVRFIFGGCKGNANNFGSFKKCKKACGGLRVNLKFAGNVKRGQNAVWQVNCNLPADQGPGRARLDRYFYDGKTNECKPFAYGGFLGNNNNFLTQEKCLDACHGRGKKFRRKQKNKRRKKGGKKNNGEAAKAAAKAASSEKAADASRGNKDKTSGLGKVGSKPKTDSGVRRGDPKRTGLGGDLQRNELMFNLMRG